MMTREEVQVHVLVGTFDTQPLVFAHLMDLASDQDGLFDPTHVDVICKTDPTPRLSHVFPETIVNQLTDLFGLRTTVVLIYPEAGALNVPVTDPLSSLGTWVGSRIVPEGHA